MHSVSRIDPASARVPPLYDPHSSGFRRAPFVDRGMGSVHMGVGVCLLDPGGVIQPHLHSFEESFYILEGTGVLKTGGKADQLRPGHFGLIPTGMTHGWSNAGDRTLRWLEMQAPQPRP